MLPSPSKSRHDFAEEQPRIRSPTVRDSRASGHPAVGCICICAPHNSRSSSMTSTRRHRGTRSTPSAVAVLLRTVSTLARTMLLVVLLIAAGGVSLVHADNAKYSLDLTGIDSGTAYTLEVKIGTSTSGKINTFRLIADTGSSNDAILGEDCCGDDADVTFDCSASSTCSEASDQVTISFAGASIGGHFATDQWSSKEIGTLTKKFMMIEQQESFYRPEYDGITGLAYEALAQPTSSPPSSFYEDLVKAGGTKDAFGMQLCGIMQPMLTTKSNFTLHAGQLLIGGITGTKGESYYSDPMLYSPIAREAWFVVVISDIGYDGKSLGIACNKYNDPQAIIDSGTSNLAFPSEIYNALMAQIRAATLKVLPNFDTNYFDATKSCCGIDYCSPQISSAVLLTLPSIYITLALQNDGSTATNQHFTVEIPPEYYWRPEKNGADNDIPCRAIGISEGSAIMLGDVFMDGLYAYHDRADKKTRLVSMGIQIGLAVTQNCPNGVNSTKKVYIATDKTDDWCSCFSSNLKGKTIIAHHLPWGSGCFFWVWWMYIVLASIVVLFIAIGVIAYWYVTDQKMKRMKASARLHHGSDAPTRAGSASSSAALIPSAAPSGYNKPPRLQQPQEFQQAEEYRNSNHDHDDDAGTGDFYVKMGSPHSASAASDTSSIALLSSPSMSHQNRLSRRPSTGKKLQHPRAKTSSRDSSYGSEEL